MSQLTKKAIFETTIALAQTRPLNKITVRDIVEACGITRNTFYYHFHDIYEVLEYAVEERFDSVRELHRSDPEAALYSLLEFCVFYKKLWFNFYKAIGYERFSAYLSKQLHSLLMDYLTDRAGVGESSLQDLNIVCAFFEEALIGIFLRWLKDARDTISKEELDGIVLRFRTLFEGHLHLALENCKDLSRKG